MQRSSWALVGALFSIFSISFSATGVAAESVAVLGVQSLEGDDHFAAELTVALRYEAGRLSDWTVAEDDVSLAQMLLLHGCTSPTATCLRQVAESLDVEQLLFGTTRRSEGGHDFRFQVALSLFDASSSEVSANVRDDLASADAEGQELRSAAERYVRVLNGLEADARLRVVSSVDAAAVFLDDDLIGRTDGGELVTHASTGLRTLRIEAEGHRPYETTVMLEATSPSTVEASLETLDSEAGGGSGSVDTGIPNWIVWATMGAAVVVGAVQVLAWVRANRAGDTLLSLPDADPVRQLQETMPDQSAHACNFEEVPADVQDICDDAETWSTVTYVTFPLAIALGVAAVSLLVIDSTGPLRRRFGIRARFRTPGSVRAPPAAKPSFASSDPSEGWNDPHRWRAAVRAAPRWPPGVPRPGPRANGFVRRWPASSNHGVRSKELRCSTCSPVPAPLAFEMLSRGALRAVTVEREALVGFGNLSEREAARCRGSGGDNESCSPRPTKWHGLFPISVRGTLSSSIRLTLRFLRSSRSSTLSVVKAAYSRGAYIVVEHARTHPATLPPGSRHGRDLSLW